MCHFSLDYPNIENLLNHPVHVTDQTSPSALIPFCFFGDQQIGRTSGNFQVPVCDIFREKIVTGQVCFEADINQFKNNSDYWEDALKKGFSFIIDLNEEYDVRHLLEKISAESNDRMKINISTVYKSTETDRKMNILLKTISKIVHVDHRVIHSLQDPVPLVLQGEGHFLLSDIKSFEVSEEFVRLDKTVTHCQMEEYREDCLSRKYRERVLSQCNCSPFYLRSYYGIEVKLH